MICDGKLSTKWLLPWNNSRQMREWRLRDFKTERFISLPALKLLPYAMYNTME